MKKLSPVLALLIVLVVLVAANPSLEKHKDMIYEDAAEQMEEEGELVGALGRLGAAAVQGLDLIDFDYHNYLVFSRVSSQDKVVSYGVLGMVFVK
jgi:hypothetical protein